MAFRREYKFEVINDTNPVQRFAVDYLFTSADDRDLHIESVGEMYLANGGRIAYVDNEASLAGRVYRHYLHQASEIDSGADYQSVVYGNYPSKDATDQVTFRLNANQYLTRPGIDKFLQTAFDDVHASSQVGKLRKQLFNSILSVQGSMRAPDLNPRTILRIQFNENAVVSNELIFEDNSKLYVTNPENNPDQAYPFQVSLTIWDGSRYL
jgi:hypothetical protein